MSKLLLPALRGSIGDWVFYSCIMPLKELGRRVSFANEIHKNVHLSDMIQRELKARRAAQIAEYLATQEERFFNSLVLAVYDRDPIWYPVSRLEGRHRKIDLEELESRIEALGVLELSANLEMYAIDGQHRLSGIKLLIEQGRATEDDQLPVVLVGHKKTATGLRRTRRLFTTLNKTAEKISKGETIALDEDDAGAIVVRRLVENHAYFLGSRIAYLPSNNLPPSNQESLTTIGNLYDVAWEVIMRLNSPTSSEVNKLSRPDDAALKECEERVIEFFEELGKRVRPMRDFFRGKDYGRVVRTNRSSDGGHLLFRPIGMKILTSVLGELRKTMELAQAMDAFVKLPMALGEKPFSGTIWDADSGTIQPKAEVLARDLLRLGLGLPVKETVVRKKLSSWLGISSRELEISDWIP